MQLKIDTDKGIRVSERDLVQLCRTLDCFGDRIFKRLSTYLRTFIPHITDDSRILDDNGNLIPKEQPNIRVCSIGTCKNTNVDTLLMKLSDYEWICEKCIERIFKENINLKIGTYT